MPLPGGGGPGPTQFCLLTPTCLPWILPWQFSATYFIYAWIYLPSPICLDWILLDSAIVSATCPSALAFPAIPLLPPTWTWFCLLQQPPLLCHTYHILLPTSPPPPYVQPLHSPRLRSLPFCNNLPPVYVHRLRYSYATPPVRLQPGCTSYAYRCLQDSATCTFAAAVVIYVRRVTVRVHIPMPFG